VVPIFSKTGYDLDLGIGLAAGYATVGNFGFEGQMDYGAGGQSGLIDLPSLRGGERRADPDKSTDSVQNRRLRTRRAVRKFAFARIFASHQSVQSPRH
jgi:hypothetical protein